MAAGYLIGSPIRYEYDPSDEIESLCQALRACDSPSVDAELAMQQSVFGRAVELCYADENARPRCIAVDPRDAFVVYSDDELARPLFGVYLRYETDLRGNRTGLRVNVYTDSLIARYRCAQAAAIREPLESVPHYFGAVPLTEYWNNARERGDFERVLPLIDAYDLLQSDRVNDKQQFADALLVLTGVMGLTAPEDGDGRTPGERLRQDKTLALGHYLSPGLYRALGAACLSGGAAEPRVRGRVRYNQSDGRRAAGLWHRRIRALRGLQRQLFAALHHVLRPGQRFCARADRYLQLSIG